MLRTLRHILRHPLNRRDRAGAVMRFLRWQLASRLMPHPHVTPFVGDTVLVMERGMTGATGNWYSGLHEHGDMAFVLHLLSPGELFADVGANVGSYTVLAGGCARAEVVSLEPIPGTFQKLRRNVVVNGIADRVTCLNIGAGSEEGTLRFTTGHDTTNHVVTEQEARTAATMDVPVRRIDDVLGARAPRLMKIDVEGWEAEVLRGMPKTLADPTLVAVITETNDSGARYGGGAQDAVPGIMRAAGFQPCSYDPLTREVTAGGTQANTIFVRDFELVRQRVAAAPRFELINGTL